MNMMNCCFPCFKKHEKVNNGDLNNVPAAHQPGDDMLLFTPQHTGHTAPEIVTVEEKESTLAKSGIEAKQYTFRELATATKHFRNECLLSESGFGRIYRGTLQPNGQVVFVKRLDKNSTQGNKEFLVEVLMLSLLRHTNLLKLVGYCADGDQKLLVYDYMPMGSVEEHLLDLKAEMQPLDWVQRMKIACGTAQGIEYLHEKANPPIIYRDLKCSNIMLDDEFNPKLSDYGLAKLGGNNKSHVTIMGSYGYCAPEYEKHGELTLKSDVYSFGVILLELISGRRAMDTSKQADEQNLVSWAQPIFKDPKRFPEMADPRLGNSFPVKSLNQAVGVAAMCLQDEPDVRPLISDVVVALSFLAMPSPEPDPTPEMKAPSRKESRRDKRETRIKGQSRKESRRDINETFGRSSESSWSECDGSFNDHEDDANSGSDYEPLGSSVRSDDEEKDYNHHQEKVKSSKYPSSSWGRLESLEYEVASMSSSSSYSDNESEHGRINKSNKIHHGNSPLKMSNKSSTNKYREDSDEGSWNEGVINRRTRKSSRNTGARLGTKGRNDMTLKDDNIGSYSRKSSNVEFDNGRGVYEKNPSIGLYSMKSSNAGSDSGRGVYEKNRSIGSYSRKSSNSGSDSGHGIYEKNQSIGLYSRVNSSAESDDGYAAYEKNQSIGSYSRQSSVSKSEDGSVGSGHHSDDDEDSEVELLT